jgi:hypothetical protein
MRPALIAGIVLVAIGAVALVYQGINYKSRDTIIDIGPVHATAETEKTLAIPPILGIAAVAGGVVLIVLGVRKRG